MRRVGAQNPSAASQPRKDFIGRAVLSRTLFPRLCCGAVLMGLREACIFATARAATKAAAKPAHVPYGQGQHVSTAGSLAPLCGTAAQRLRSAKHYFRSSSPSMPHDHAAGTRRSRLATLAPPAVKVFFNTILRQSRRRFVIDRRKPTA